MKKSYVAPTLRKAGVISDVTAQSSPSNWVQKL